MAERRENDEKTYRQRTFTGFYSDLRPKESHLENKPVRGTELVEIAGRR
jgi:hypothetical protein